MKAQLIVLINSRKRPLFLLVATLIVLVSRAQIDAYYASTIFNTPNNQPFVETYLTIVGKTLKAREVEYGLQNSVNVNLVIRRDSQIVKVNKYNINGPVVKGDTIPSFIDNQRYALANGRYEIELTLSDNIDPTKKPLVIKENIAVNFPEGQLSSSGIQILESYKKANVNGPLTKSGFDMVPYTVDFFPETTKELIFYYEIYNSHKTEGITKNFVVNYYLEMANGSGKLNSYGAFKKYSPAAVTQLLAKMDISKLGSGTYNLVIDVKDENNELVQQKKFAFQRLNRSVDITELQKLSEKENIAEFVGRCNNADTLKMFVECLWPIADGIDKERIINQSIKKEPELMKKFVVDFWQRRAADTANPLKLWATYYKQVQQVMVLFKCGKQPGYYTDRGRVYLQYGAPSQRSQQPVEPNTYPYEIWQYYRTTDQTNGQFFSNRRFVFVNRTLGDDCYNLIHSDMRGEVNNPRWQFELTRRNNNGLANPDNTTPSGTEHNQFNEIYNNPR